MELGRAAKPLPAYSLRQTANAVGRTVQEERHEQSEQLFLILNKFFLKAMHLMEIFSLKDTGFDSIIDRFADFLELGNIAFISMF